jgi:hypothetical protein
MRITIMFTSCLLFIGCVGASAEKGDEGAGPVDGAADSFASPTEHGRLMLGVNPAELSRGERFHSWTFTITGEDNPVRLRTVGDEDLDTVLYLYRLGDQGWGRFIARNDDADGTLLSSLDEVLDAGDYRVIVKGYDETVVGEFDVDFGCDSVGCQATLARASAADLERSFGFLAASLPHSPRFVSASGDDSRLSAEIIRAAFTGVIEPVLAENGIESSGHFLHSLEVSRAWTRELARAAHPRYSSIAQLLEDNLVDLRLLQVGRADAGGALDPDRGPFLWMLVGRTVDRRIAGYFIVTAGEP